MAGYSGTPLPRKLGIKPRARVRLVRAPDDFEAELIPLPDGVQLTADSGDGADVILAFCRTRTELEHSLGRLPSSMDPSGGLWIVWPKKSSGIETDVTEALVRELGLATGLVDNKVCAVSDVWSGLRFVVRLADRPNRSNGRH